MLFTIVQILKVQLLCECIHIEKRRRKNNFFFFSFVFFFRCCFMCMCTYKSSAIRRIQNDIDHIQIIIYSLARKHKQIRKISSIHRFGHQNIYCSQQNNKTREHQKDNNTNKGERIKYKNYELPLTLLLLHDIRIQYFDLLLDCNSNNGNSN